jgi:uncharacterized protein YbjT (DUF2867 family)
MANTKTALIIGATGLTGEQCLNELLATQAYSKVIALVRKPLNIQNPKLEVQVVDFDKLDNFKTVIKADDIYCTMGTTIGKAGSQEAFKKVDYEYPLKTAEIALWNGAKKFILVSSLGADANSSVFYSRTKGELEEALKKLNYTALLIFRPSILLGDRTEKRVGEQIGRFVAEKFSFLFAGPLQKYKGTPVSLLAKQMVKAANTDSYKGAMVIENEAIFEMAKK